MDACNLISSISGGCDPVLRSRPRVSEHPSVQRSPSSCLICRLPEIPCIISSPDLLDIPVSATRIIHVDLLDHWHNHPLAFGVSEQDRELKHGYICLGFSHHYLLCGILCSVISEELRWCLLSRNSMLVHWYTNNPQCSSIFKVHSRRE